MQDIPPVSGRGIKGGGSPGDRAGKPDGDFLGFFGATVSNPSTNPQSQAPQGGVGSSAGQNRFGGAVGAGESVAAPENGTATGVPNVSSLPRTVAAQAVEANASAKGTAPAPLPGQGENAPVVPDNNPGQPKPQPGPAVMSRPAGAGNPNALGWQSSGAPGIEAIVEGLPATGEKAVPAPVPGVVATETPEATRGTAPRAGGAADWKPGHDGGSAGKEHQAPTQDKPGQPVFPELKLASKSTQNAAPRVTVADATREVIAEMMSSGPPGETSAARVALPVSAVVGLSATPSMEAMPQSVPTLTDVPQPQSELLVLKSDMTRLTTDVRSILIRALGDGASEARLDLHPPDLGSVQVRLVEQNGALRLLFEVQSRAVRDALVANQAQLTEMMSEQGLEVTDFTVDVRSGRGDAQSFETRGGADGEFEDGDDSDEADGEADDDEAAASPEPSTIVDVKV